MEKRRRPISRWIGVLTIFIANLAVQLCVYLILDYPIFNPSEGPAPDYLNGYFLAFLFEGGWHFVALTTAGFMGPLGFGQITLWSMELSIKEPTAMELFRERQRKGVKPYVFALVGAAYGLGAALAVHANVPTGLAALIALLVWLPAIIPTFYYFYLIKPYSLGDKQPTKASVQASRKEHPDD